MRGHESAGWAVASIAVRRLDALVVTRVIFRSVNMVEVKTMGRIVCRVICKIFCIPGLLYSAEPLAAHPAPYVQATSMSLMLHMELVTETERRRMQVRVRPDHTPVLVG